MNVDSTNIRKFLLTEYLEGGGQHPQDFIRGMVWFEGLMTDQMDKGRLQDSVPDNYIIRNLEETVEKKNSEIQTLKRRIKDYRTLGKNERQILKKDAQYKELWKLIERLKADNDRLVLQLKGLGVDVSPKADVPERNGVNPKTGEMPDFNNINVYPSREGDKLLIDCEINGKKFSAKPFCPEDKEVYGRVEGKGDEQKTNAVKYHLAQKYFYKEMKREKIKPKLAI